MKISYHTDTNALYIHLSDAPTAESEEVAEDTVLHFDETGNVTGMEVYGGASEKADLSTLDIVGLERQAPTVRALDSTHHGWAWLRKDDKPPANPSWFLGVKNVGVPIGGTAIRSKTFKSYNISKDDTRELANDKNLDQRPV